jgi:hypothetical protein
LLDRVVRELVPLPGVRAVALGGSHAAGSARPDSDLDVGVYYLEAEPLDTDAIGGAAARLDPRSERVVTGLWEWGPWVNGGAWLLVDGQPVDLLYRSLDQLDQTLDACQRGELEWHYAQQPSHGFHSHTLLAELAICRVLHDPDQLLAERVGRVARYPSALRRSVVQDFLWHVEFSLLHARTSARRGDVYNTVGCLNRSASCLVQVLHAEAERWFLGDKRALAALEPRVAVEIEEILGCPGRTAAELSESVERMARLFEQAVARVGNAYRRPVDLPAARGLIRARRSD